MDSNGDVMDAYIHPSHFGPKGTGTTGEHYRDPSLLVLTVAENPSIAEWHTLFAHTTDPATHTPEPNFVSVSMWPVPVRVRPARPKRQAA